MPNYPQLPNSFPVGRTLLIVGTASSGPLHTPIYIRTQEEASRYFGVELSNPCKEALLAGASYVIGMRIGNDSSDTLTKNELYIALERTYDQLLGFPCDLILPLGAYYDDAHDILTHGTDYITFAEIDGSSMNFAFQLARFCYRKLQQGEFCHGIIGTSRPDVNDIDGWFNNIIPLDPLGELDESKKITDYGEDIGRHISIVPSWVIFKDQDGNEYSASGAASYAGLIASLESSTSPTYHTLPVIRLDSQFSDSQLDKFSLCGMVPFRTSIRHGVVPYNAVTFAMPESDFYDICNVRVANEACVRVKNVIEIGSKANIATPKMRAEAVLKEMAKQGSIRDFEIDTRWLSSTSAEIRMSLGMYSHAYFIDVSVRVRLRSTT
jgi:hypothetical protein